MPALSAKTRLRTTRTGSATRKAIVTVKTVQPPTPHRGSGRERRCIRPASYSTLTWVGRPSVARALKGGCPGRRWPSIDSANDFRLQWSARSRGRSGKAAGRLARRLFGVRADRPVGMAQVAALVAAADVVDDGRSEEHKFELQSLMRISYAV